jgi:hypothetical protein
MDVAAAEHAAGESAAREAEAVSGLAAATAAAAARGRAEAEAEAEARVDAERLAWQAAQARAVAAAAATAMLDGQREAEAARQQLRAGHEWELRQLGLRLQAVQAAAAATTPAAEPVSRDDFATPGDAGPRPAVGSGPGPEFERAVDAEAARRIAMMDASFELQVLLDYPVNAVFHLQCNSDLELIAPHLLRIRFSL